jgi:hypothetical protein
VGFLKWIVYNRRRCGLEKDYEMLKFIFSRENVFAVALCMIVLMVVIVTADSAPQWIYQGF